MLKGFTVRQERVDPCPNQCGHWARIVGEALIPDASGHMHHYNCSVVNPAVFAVEQSLPSQYGLVDMVEQKPVQQTAYFTFKGISYAVKMKDGIPVYRDEKHLGGPWSNAFKALECTFFDRTFKKLLADACCRLDP